MLLVEEHGPVRKYCAAREFFGRSLSVAAGSNKVSAGIPAVRHTEQVP
jgi:hypothetical protein